jgi:hypothetical protein
LRGTRVAGLVAASLVAANPHLILLNSHVGGTTFLVPFLTTSFLWLLSRTGPFGPSQVVSVWRAVAPYFIIWPSNLAAWLDNLHYLADQLQQQLPAVVLLAGTFAFMTFVVVFPTAVWAPAALMPSVLFLVLGLAIWRST